MSAAPSRVIAPQSRWPLKTPAVPPIAVTQALPCRNLLKPHRPPGGRVDPTRASTKLMIRDLPPLGVEPGLEAHRAALEQRHAVAEQVVPAVLGGREPDPRRADEPAPDRPARSRPRRRGGCRRRSRRPPSPPWSPCPTAPARARRLAAPRRRHPRREAQRRPRRRAVAERHRHPAVPEPLGLVHQQHPHLRVDRQARSAPTPSGRRRRPCRRRSRRPAVVAEADLDQGLQRQDVAERVVTPALQPGPRRVTAAPVAFRRPSGPCRRWRCRPRVRPPFKRRP